ncbi:hypothetical protein GGQ85_003327 [Nitrobacter vulgaris]|nr:hypothetical protein [Nitrobacter vulgaris]
MEWRRVPWNHSQHGRGFDCIHIGCPSR